MNEQLMLRRGVRGRFTTFLYREAPLQSPTLYSLAYYFERKDTSLDFLLLKKVPLSLTYLRWLKTV